MMWFMLQVYEHILWYLHRLATEEPSKPDTIGTVLNGEVSSFQGLLSTFLEPGAYEPPEGRKERPTAFESERL